MKEDEQNNGSIILRKGQGRTYACGTMTAVFKADEEETTAKYSVSEWWLEPNSAGPGAHLHDENDEVFYVIGGKPSLLVGDKWIDGQVGDFFRIPAKTMHDFANNTNEKCGLLNFFIPGGFERNMPAIVKWFEENPI
jgi:mannose-6-phosphate isomerase-like protein (cupin superfamily)